MSQGNDSPRNQSRSRSPCYSEYVLFIEGLSSKTDSATVRRTFEDERCGVESVRLFSRGRCLVDMRSRSDARHAWKRLDRCRIDGSTWRVDYAEYSDFVQLDLKPSKSVERQYRRRKEDRKRINNATSSHDKPNEEDNPALEQANAVLLADRFSMAVCEGKSIVRAHLAGLFASNVELESGRVNSQDLAMQIAMDDLPSWRVTKRIAFFPSDSKTAGQQFSSACVDFVVKSKGFFFGCMEWKELPVANSEHAIIQWFESNGVISKFVLSEDKNLSSSPSCDLETAMGHASHIVGTVDEMLGGAGLPKVYDYAKEEEEAKKSGL